MPSGGVMIVFALGSLLYLGVLGIGSAARKVSHPIKKVSCKLIHKGCAKPIVVQK